MAQLDSEEDEDVIRIICRGHSASTLYELQQTAISLVLRVIDTCCPGVYLQPRALSPRDIREGDRARPRAYSTLQVTSAQTDGTDEVRISDGEVEETLKEVLSLAAQCIVIGHVCFFVGFCVCLWVCYHDTLKLRVSIFTKLGL